MTRRRSLVSLRLRLSALFGLLFVLTASALLLALAQRQGAQDEARMLHQAGEIAAHIATLTRREVAANDRIAIAARLESFNEFEDIALIVITDRQGQPLAAVRRNAAGNLSATSRREIPLDRPADTSPMRIGAPADGRATIRAAIGQIAPIGWVQMEIDTRRIDAQRKALLTRFALLAFASAALATLVFAFFIGRFNDPVLHPPREDRDAPA